MMSKNNPNAIYPPIWFGKIKKSHVSEVEKIKEHVRRSTSKKGSEKKNCTEQSEWETINVRDAELLVSKITSKLDHERTKDRITFFGEVGYQEDGKKC